MADLADLSHQQLPCIVGHDLISGPHWIWNGYSKTRTSWQEIETTFSLPIKWCVCPHVYDTLLTALRANSMRSHWTLPMLCRAMAKAYSMKLRSDRLFSLSNYQVVCNCEWIILKFYLDSDLC